MLMKNMKLICMHQTTAHKVSLVRAFNDFTRYRSPLMCDASADAFVSQLTNKALSPNGGPKSKPLSGIIIKSY